MRQTYVHLHSRIPTIPATRYGILNFVRNASSRTSSHATSPFRSHLTLQREVAHRSFHITIPNNRRPPPIKISKPQSQPDTDTRTYRPKPQEPPAFLAAAWARAESVVSGSGIDNTHQNRQQQQQPPPPVNGDGKEGRNSWLNPAHAPKPRKPRWPFAALLIFAAVVALADDAILSAQSPPKPLNQDTFVPFTIISREQVSPTAFLLTLGPAPPRSPGFVWKIMGRIKGGSEDANDSVDVIKRAWEHGLWSVEVKQPELQVARDYTPLPSSPSLVGEAGPVEGNGRLRLYIRRMEKGEVSGYLARLKVGDTVELRGPRLAFDVRRRVGVGDDGDGVMRKEEKGKKKVIFFAGGTGIAPALQAARALLDHPAVEMEVVWANRRREDCVGCDGGEKKGPVVAMMEELRTRYGERFRYSCTLDEEGSFIDAKTVTQLAQVSGPAPALRQSTWGLWSSTGGRNSTGVAAPSSAVNTDDCSYHSAKKLVVSDDKDTPAGADGQRCQCKDGEGNPVKGGKNLLMFSGPDGFMAHYVGAKVWAGGKELQGPVKGAVGDLKRKYPSFGEDWLVLKM